MCFALQYAVTEKQQLVKCLGKTDKTASCDPSPPQQTTTSNQLSTCAPVLLRKIDACK